MNRKEVILEIELLSIQLQKGLDILEYSIIKSDSIDIQEKLNYEELETMEALTSRFSRLSDIFTQKFLKSFFYLLGETNLTLIDKANYLEKLEIVNSAEDLLEIRELRNSISHEYILEELQDLFSDVISIFPKLKIIINTSISYAKENLTKY